MANYAVNILLRAKDAASRGVRNVRQSLNRTGSEARRAGGQMDQFGNRTQAAGRQGTRSLRGIGGQFGRLRKQATSTARAVRERLGGAFRSLGRTASRINVGPIGALSGALAGGLGAYGLVRAFKGAINSAASFEEELSRVKAISGATDQQMQRMREEANRLGRTTRFTATQAAQGFTELSRAGFTVDESLQALESTLNLAQADGIKLGRAAEIVSDSLNGMGIAASETRRATDVMAQAASSANTNVVRMGNALSYAGPSAKAAGISLEGTAAAIASLQDAGIQGTRAGTQLRAILQQIQDPGTKAAKALDKMGIETGSLTEMVRGLNRAGPQASEAINAFTRESRTAVRVLMEKGAPGLRDFQQELENSDGRAQEMADTMNDNLRGAVAELGSAWDAFSRKLIRPLIGPITREVDRLASSFRRLTDSGLMQRLQVQLLVLFRQGSRAVRNFLRNLDIRRTLKAVGKSLGTFGAIIQGLGKTMSVVVRTFRIGWNVLYSTVNRTVAALTEPVTWLTDALAGLVRILHTVGAVSAGTVKAVQGISDSVKDFQKRAQEASENGVKRIVEDLKGLVGAGDDASSKMQELAEEQIKAEKAALDNGQAQNEAANQTQKHAQTADELADKLQEEADAQEAAGDAAQEKGEETEASSEKSKQALEEERQKVEELRKEVERLKEAQESRESSSGGDGGGSETDGGGDGDSGPTDDYDDSDSGDSFSVSTGGGGGGGTADLEQGVQEGTSQLASELKRIADTQVEAAAGERSERKKIIDGLHEATMKGDTEAIKQASRALQAIRQNEQEGQAQAGRPASDSGGRRVVRLELGNSDGTTEAEMDVPEAQAENVLSALEESGARVAE